MDLESQRWATRYDRYGVGIEPVENGCRSYDCCNGADCGSTLAEAQADIVAHYQGLADRIRAMTPDEFLRHQGYAPQPRGEGEPAGPSEASACAEASRLASAEMGTFREAMKVDLDDFDRKPPPAPATRDGA